jgi:hypothetical protein
MNQMRAMTVDDEAIARLQVEATNRSDSGVVLVRMILLTVSIVPVVFLIGWSLWWAAFHGF